MEVTFILSSREIFPLGLGYGFPSLSGKETTSAVLAVHELRVAHGLKASLQTRAESKYGTDELREAG